MVLFNLAPNAKLPDQMGWPTEQSVVFPFWEIWGFGPCGFKPWPDKPMTLKLILVAS